MSIRRGFLLATLILVFGAALWWRNLFAQEPPSRPTSPAQERIVLLRCLMKNYRDPVVTDTVPILEGWMKEDPDSFVRYKAIELRGMIAYEHEKKVCPLSVAQALLDKEADPREAAELAASLLKEFPPEVIAVVLTAAKNADADMRGKAMQVVALVADRNKEARTVLAAARNDKEFGIRHNAHAAWFKLTDDLDIFLPYCLQIQVEFGNLPPPPADSSEKVKRERFSKQLMRAGVLRLVHQQGEQRTEKVASLIFDQFKNETPLIRRCAAAFIAYLADDTLKVPRKAKAVKDGTTFDEEKRDDFELEHVYSLKLITRLSELNIDKKLLQLERDDGDQEVRETAAAARKKWSALHTEIPAIEKILSDPKLRKKLEERDARGSKSETDR
jgi:hypothetical protein